MPPLQGNNKQPVLEKNRPMKINKHLCFGFFLIILLSALSSFARLSPQTNSAPASAPSSTTFTVSNGAFPWADRVNTWQLSSVPASVDGNGPLPQQSCGNRMIVVPDGAKY